MTDPQHCDLVVVGADILDFESPESCMTGCSIAIADGLIVAVGPSDRIDSAWTAQQRIDASGSVVCPGFIDAHVHFGAFLGAGRPYSAPRTEGMFSGGGRPEAVVPAMAAMLGAPVPDDVVSAVVAPANTSTTHHLGVEHPVPALGLHARASDVTTVIVAGRVLVHDGVLVDGDERELRSRAGSVVQSMTSRSQP